MLFAYLKQIFNTTQMKRKIIKFNDDKCIGCGDCIPACPEGAIQIIDGKARLISDLFCDGLGACVGSCPYGAIDFEMRESKPHDEKLVMSNISQQGKNVIKAHLKHLQDHNDTKNLTLAIDYLNENNISVPEKFLQSTHPNGSNPSCLGSKIFDYSSKSHNQSSTDNNQIIKSELKQWPIQLHLISPNAPYYQKKDVLLAADCTAFVVADFHNVYLKNKSIAIACPKLDSGLDIYTEKIKQSINEAKINLLNVMIMEVPCCSGLLQIAINAAKASNRKIPIKKILVSIQGNILSEEWVDN